MAQDTRDIFIKILLVIVGLLGGFGLSQITVAGQVQIHTQAITDLKVSNDRIFERLNTLVEQNTAVITQNTSIIQLYIGSVKK